MTLRVRPCIPKPRPRHHPDGQALTEFALVAPMFFLLMFGIIQLGLLFGGQNGLVSAARELTRYAAPFHVATSADATNVCNTASGSHGLGTQLTESMQRAIPGYDATAVATRRVTYHWDTNADGSHYVQIELRVAYRFPLYVPLVAALLDGFDGVNDNALQLDATETMRIENESLTSTYADVACTI